MRIPSNTGSKFPTQKPSIDKVAEHIDDVVTVATSITSGQFDKVSVPAVGVVAGIHKQVVAVAEVEQYVRMLALDLSNVDTVAKELGGVLNVSNNMATVLLLHSRMADLMNIQKSLVHIDAVALNEEAINSVFEAIPEITTLVAHLGDLIKMAQVLPHLETVFDNLDALILTGFNISHVVRVSENMETILEASVYVAEIYTLMEEVRGIEANVIALEASTKNQADIATEQADIATSKASEATVQANAASSSATAANASAVAAKASEASATASATTATNKAAEAANSAASTLDSKDEATAAINTVNQVKVGVVAIGEHVDAVQVIVDAHRAEVASNTSQVAADKGLVEAAKIAAMDAAGISEANKVSTEQNAESAKTARDEAVSAAGTAVSAKDCIVSDAIDVRSLAVQVAAQSSDVSIKHGDVVAKAAQASDDVAATQSAKNISVAAADTAAQKAADAAGHEAVSLNAATRAENAALSMVGAIIDGGECDLSGGVYPQPVSASGITYSTVWFVAVGGTVGGVAYDAGDQLRYTTANSGYYFKVDAKDDVYSVNGEKGAVTVTPEKIGAEASGTASQLITQHEAKPSAHAIEGVAGLRAELDDIKAAGGDAVLDVKWLTTRTPMRTGYTAGDGQTLPRALYPDAIAAIQAGLVPVCTDAEWLADPAKRGCFTLGDGATTFRVPDYNGVQPGSYGPVYLGGSMSEGGTILRDRIQNITGSTSRDTGSGILYGNSITTGAFYRGDQRGYVLTGQEGAGYDISFDASRVARTGNTTRPITAEGCLAIKLFGAVQNAGSADAAALATAVADLAARVSVLEQRKSTCLVNAIGTGAPHETVVAQLPANILKDTRYVLPNPFGINTPVECWAEVFANGKWSRTGFVFGDPSGYGADASYVQGEGIVVQTGGVALLADSAMTGGGHGVAGAVSVQSAPCRVFVRKLEA